MGPNGNRHAVITPDDHGAILQMATWFMMVTMILAAFTRLAIRFTTSQIPGLDDAVVVLSVLTSTGSAVAISLAVKHGLGKRSVIIRGDTEELEKDMYIANLLYLLTIGLSKISVVLFFGRLAVAKAQKTAVKLLGASVTLWLLPSFIALAFHCKLPRPWGLSGRDCFPILPYWQAVSSIDIITDTVMIALPVWIVWNLQMKRQKKAVVIFVFTFRLLLIIAAIARLVYTGKLIDSSDPTFDGIPAAICTQCHSTLAVIVACTPALKPFLDRTKSGMLNASLRPRAPGTTYGSHGTENSYQLQPISSSQQSSGKGSQQRSGAKSPAPQPFANLKTPKPHKGNGEKAPMAAGPRDRRDSRDLRPDFVQYQSEVRCERRGSAEIFRTDDSGSVESSGSEQKIIRQTRRWDVRYDDYHNRTPALPAVGWQSGRRA